MPTPLTVHQRVQGRTNEVTRARFVALVEPGDIVLERNDVTLLDAFFAAAVPGYWTHAMRAPGTVAQWRARLDGDPAVRAWVKQRLSEQPNLPRVRDFSEYMAAAYPEYFAASLAYDARGGAWIEAGAPGVVLSSVESTTSDNLALLRPNLSNAALADSIEYTVRQLGKPYDVFSLSYQTDDAVICSELVAKGIERETSARFPRRDLLGIGRNVAPDDLAGYYAAHASDERPLLSFVAFTQSAVPGRDMQSPRAERDFRLSCE